MFWEMEGNQETDPLMDLLNNPNAAICEVMNMETMLQELRTGNTDLFNYLMRPAVVTELCDWSMTMKNKDSPDFHHFSRTATETLTCPSFAKVVVQSPVLKTFIASFLSAEEEWDALVAGHFQRVLVVLLEQNREYLNEFPNAVASIEKRLQLPAVGELVSTLATKFAYISASKPIVMDLARLIAESDGNVKPYLFTLRQIFEEGLKDASRVESVVEASTNEQFMTFLIAAAKKTSDKVARAEIFRFLLQLETRSAESAAVIRPLVAAIPESDPVTSDAAFALLTKIEDPKEILTRLVKGPVHWALATELMGRVKKMKKPEFMAAVDAVDVIAVLKGPATDGALTPQQMEILSLINKYDPENARLKAEIPPAVVARVALIGERYGGEIPIEAQGASHNLNAE